jgi:hypothetical protein
MHKNHPSPVLEIYTSIIQGKGGLARLNKVRICTILPQKANEEIPT